jgi:hypothetical protein
MAADPPAPAHGEHERVAAHPGTNHYEAVPRPLLDKVLADAAQRTALESSELQIVSTEKITWNDGSLGCPQPDRMYTQALVPGYRIRIQSPDGILEYHAAATGNFVLCSLPQVPPEDRDAR